MKQTLEHFGNGGVCDRALSLLELPSIEALPADLSLSSPHFACLIAFDAIPASTEQVSRLAHSLLSQGAVYICAWGHDCGRIHDIFDEVIVGPGPAVPQFSDGIMTTWHEDEPFDEALWYLLQVSFPDDAFFETCQSSVVITIANSGWADRARNALEAPKLFCSQTLKSG